MSKQEAVYTVYIARRLSLFLRSRQREHPFDEIVSFIENSGVVTFDAASFQA